MSTSRAGARGFTLIEIVIVLAVVSVLAGTLVPYAIKQIDGAREDASSREMASIAEGIRAYHEDTGELPSERAGLSALVRNTDRRSGWNGPYVNGAGDLRAAIQTDAWGEPYVYAPRASVRGLGGTVDFLVVSPGPDRVLDSRARRGRWRLDEDADRVLVGSTDASDRRRRAETTERLEAMAAALEMYYVDVGAFPAGRDGAVITELVRSRRGGWRGPYLAGTAGDVVRDGWGRSIRVRACTHVNRERVTGWILLSDGPGPPNAVERRGSFRTADDDAHVVVTEASLARALDRARTREARKALALEAGAVYDESPAASPPSGDRRTRDPWGRPYRYEKHATYAGRVVSDGPDPRDRSDDLDEALLWSPGGGAP